MYFIDRKSVSEIKSFIMKYLEPYNNYADCWQRYILGEKDETDKIVWWYYIRNIKNCDQFVVHCGNEKIEKKFNSLNEAQKFLDEKLLEQEYVLLTKEQYDKLIVLL
jgi:hypothetical protein